MQYSSSYGRCHNSLPEAGSCGTEIQSGSELPMNCSSEEITATAIKISMHGIQIEITNVAAESTIVQTLTALQKLC